MLQVVAETDEPFVPVPDELIVNLRESREAVEALLDNLASSFATATSVSPLELQMLLHPPQDALLVNVSQMCSFAEITVEERLCVLLKHLCHVH